jgi:hypothetical protein
VHSLVIWNGQDWVNLSPTPLTGTVTHLQSLQSDLMVGGTSLALAGAPQAGILRWNQLDSAWTLTTGLSGTLRSMTFGANQLYASANNIHRFDPGTNAWTSLVGSPFTGKIIADSQGRWIHATGYLPDLGITGCGRVSLGVPLLDRQPENAVVRRGDPVGFSVDVLTQRSASDTLTNRTTYLWRRDGVNLTNGTTPHGSIISSATGPWLRINNAQTQDQGVYDCVVTAVCSGSPAPTGSITTSQATLTVTIPICDSVDFNNDGLIFDPTDVDAFFSVFSEGPCIPALATCNDVDFNNDGSVFDPKDIDAFLSVFGEGPCF